MAVRRAGVLAHVTSLPGAGALGQLGAACVEFLDWAAEAGQRVWQVLPLGPPGAGYSPYSSLSAFAGNELLIASGELRRSGWIGAHEEPAPAPSDAVDFGAIVPHLELRLRHAWLGFQRAADAEERQALASFAEHEDQRPWLEDWVRFAALRRRFQGRPWWTWDEDLRLRNPRALRAVAVELADELALRRFAQFVFDRQWRRVHAAARDRGVAILGDLPFYPAYDSADVWCRPELFDLEPSGLRRKVAGVPPDYFSETGQLWGNPIYRWDRLASRGYDFWVERTRAALGRVDVLRLDHFRGYAAYWEVDAEAPTASAGRWVAGPGAAPFLAVGTGLAPLPFVAEDLGSITEDVHVLRRQLGIPGMRVAQFGFDEEESDHRPDRCPPDAVLYTGTHDNDTVRGWFEGLAPEQQRRVRAHLGHLTQEVGPRMIEAAYDSAAELVIVPLQDLLGLGSEARMNRPGVADGNWRWRARDMGLTLRLAERVRRLAERSGRLA